MTLATRPLGTSGLDITPVGLGAWAIGGGEWKYGWGSQDDRASIAAINRAVELGLNWIDTAAIYGIGHSEEVWTLAWQGVTGAIVGARSADQIGGWVGGAAVRLGPDDLAEIAAAIEATGAGSGPTRPDAPPTSRS